ncbi:hypothetical protein COOONC_15043 [Cooperia oncophora]
MESIRRTMSFGNAGKTSRRTELTTALHQETARPVKRTCGTSSKLMDQNLVFAERNYLNSLGTCKQTEKNLDDGIRLIHRLSQEIYPGKIYYGLSTVWNYDGVDVQKLFEQVKKLMPEFNPNIIVTDKALWAVDKVPWASSIVDSETKLLPTWERKVKELVEVGFVVNFGQSYLAHAFMKTSDIFWSNCTSKNRTKWRSTCEPTTSPIILVEFW